MFLNILFTNLDKNLDFGEIMRRFNVEYPFVIKIINTGYEYKWDSTFDFAGETHDSWEFVCVLEGEVEIVEDDNVYRLCAGSFIAHAPLEFHRIKSSNNTNPHLFVLSFVHGGKIPEQLADGVFFLAHEEVEEYSAIARDIIKSLYATSDEAANLGSESALLLNAFVIKLLNRHSPHKAFASSKSAENYRKVIQVMQNGLYDNLSLEEISAICAMSTSSIKALFRQYAGIGPKTYYTNMRATEAMRLMNEGKSVEETSDMLNFSSVGYFSYFFKKYFGKPPSFFKN